VKRGSPNDRILQQDNVKRPNADAPVPIGYQFHILFFVEAAKLS